MRVGLNLEYEAELDLTALATFNGSDVQGRQQTATQAKLALLVLAKNLKDSSPSGNYRLRVTFKGLPSQSGLAGEKVYASSSWAYTGGSPVLAAYEKELITHFCAGGVQSALYGKADVLPSEVEPAAAGCATGGTPAGTAFGIALVLMLLVLRRRGHRRAAGDAAGPPGPPGAAGDRRTAGPPGMTVYPDHGLRLYCRPSTGGSSCWSN